jgi:hypothetical protein
MHLQPDGPDDDVSSAPESGTVRDDTSGNEPAHPHERGVLTRGDNPSPQAPETSGDDPSFAGEER